MRCLIAWIISIVMSAAGACAHSQSADTGSASPATQPIAGKLPHVQVDVNAKQIRVDCQMLGVNVPIEFFCVLAGTSEHESVLRTEAKPSNIHLGLVMLGLEPGEPVKFSEAAKKWLPPHGPPLSISVEFEKDGKVQRLPASRLVRSIKTGKSMPQQPFIFAGSRVAPDGTYAADVTGYVVSIVNFDLSLIDVPQLASNANDTLEWEIDKDVAPASGTMLTMIIEPTGGGALKSPATQPSPRADRDVERVDITKLRERWQQSVRPHETALRDAAQSHYQAITQLRREQQQLIDQADQIQRLIDELEKQYQQMTTPQPASREPSTSEP